MSVDTTAAAEDERERIVRYLRHVTKVEVGTLIGIFGPQAREIVDMVAGWIENRLDERWDARASRENHEQYLLSAGWWRSASGQDPKDDRWSLGGVHSNTPLWEMGSRWLMQPHVAGPLTLHEAVEEQRRRDEVPVGGPKPRGARKTATKRRQAR